MTVLCQSLDFRLLPFENCHPDGMKSLIPTAKNEIKASCSHSNQSPRGDWIHIDIVKVTIELRKGMALSQEISTPTINNNFRR